MQQSVENAEIITLAFHVDYWDYLGWKDEFSSPVFSRRQKDYTEALKLRSNYTPQMIVDGTREFVGSREQTAVSEIEKAAKKQKADVKISVSDNSKVSVEIEELYSKEELVVMLAVAEDNLETNVKAGENRGKELSHVSVVRAIAELGRVKPKDEKFFVSRDLKMQAGWKKENLKFVVFVQNPKSREIFAVGTTRIN